MDFELSPAEEAFRAEVRQFLKENLPPPRERGPTFMKECFVKGPHLRNYTNKIANYGELV